MIEIRLCREFDEFRHALYGIGHYTGSEHPPDWAERFARVFPWERMHGAFEDGRVVGGAGSFPLELTIPGGQVPTAGVTVVGVLPTHRRRGVLSALMRAQLDDVRERGEPLAALWASEEPIYGRFGYGMASLGGELRLARPYAALVAGEDAGRVRLLNVEEALEAFPPVYDAVRLETPGMYARSRAWWEHRVLSDPPERRYGAGPHVRALVELDGRPAAYAIYRMRSSWEEGSSSGAVEVAEAVGASPAATRAVWRYLLAIDWAAEVRASQLPVDHPLWHLLAYPRRMRLRVGDQLWLRLVDVGAALAARGAGEGVVVELADEFCPWNAGRWTSAGERTGAEPDLRLDVQALASVYLGGFTFAELARAGRVEGSREALARADAIFVSDRRPWTPEIF